MPKATPPDLRDDGQHGRALARRYSRGVRIDQHAHDWAQVLYAVAGVMWVEAGREAKDTLRVSDEHSAGGAGRN